jgi:hypothetical protein
MNYREKIRKAIECPQLTGTAYGEWGALRLDQKRLIERLLDELDSADNFILHLNEENAYLQKKVELLENQVTEYQDEIFARDNNWYDVQD